MIGLGSLGAPSLSVVLLCNLPVDGTLQRAGVAFKLACSLLEGARLR